MLPRAMTTPRPDSNRSERAKMPVGWSTWGQGVMRDSALIGYSITASLIVLFLYLPTMNYEFVNWDDPWYVQNNSLIQSWNWDNLHAIATQTVTRNYAPITIFSYLLDYTLWGEWAGGYHLTNLLLHWMNVVLVFVIVRQVTGRAEWAMLTGILFAVHPIQLESVAWVSARKGLLSSAFILASLIYWLRPGRTEKEELWGHLFYVLAIFSKAIGIIVPGIVFVYDWLVRKKTLAEAASRQIIGFFIAVWFTLLTMGSQNTVGGGVRHHFELNKFEIIGLDAVLLWRYLWMLLFPGQRSILYDPPITGIAIVATLSVIFWCGFCYFLWIRRHQNGMLVFAVAAAIAPLVPVLNLVPLTTIMNDRYLYLSCIPLFTIGIAGGEMLTVATMKFLHWPACDIRACKMVIVNTVGGLLMMAYAGMTTHQLPIWQNDLALWTNAVQQSPDLPVVQYQYALSLWNSGQQREAMKHIEIAIQLPRVDRFDQERFAEQRDYFKEQQHPIVSHDQTQLQPTTL